MARHYYITVKEHLDDSWSTWFDGLTITHATDGATTLAGRSGIRTLLRRLLIFWPAHLSRKAVTELPIPLDNQRLASGPRITEENTR